jgi:hypothetical protein
MKKLLSLMGLEAVFSMDNSTLGFPDFRENLNSPLEGLNLNATEIQNELDY